MIFPINGKVSRTVRMGTSLALGREIRGGSLIILKISSEGLGNLLQRDNRNANSHAMATKK